MSERECHPEFHTYSVQKRIGHSEVAYVLDYLARLTRFERATPAFGDYGHRLALTVDIWSNIGEI